MNIQKKTEPDIIKPGQCSPQLPSIKNKLVDLGFLRPEDNDSAEQYDLKTQDAIVAFQRAHLGKVLKTIENPNGIIDPGNIGGRSLQVLEDIHRIQEEAKAEQHPPSMEESLSQDNLPVLKDKKTILLLTTHGGKIIIPWSQHPDTQRIVLNNEQEVREYLEKNIHDVLKFYTTIYTDEKRQVLVLCNQEQMAIVLQGASIILYFNNLVSQQTRK